MTALAEEIQKIADNADKCINYPIGEKLDEFFRQEQGNEANFVLSGVIIYAAARIYGRKVDYLEQEITGMAKNFEDVGITDEHGEKKSTEVKKSRTKKFHIHDSVNIRKFTFDEKPVVESTRDEIHKIIPDPTRINLLQKMKEFFSKNRSKQGKTVIPKKLLFTGDFLTPNFGATQIYDYDDHKDIVGSRKDFTCFSYYINNYTGELQNEVNYALQIRIEEDAPSHPELDLDHIFSPNFSRPETPNDRMQSPLDFFMTPPRSPEMAKISVDDEISIREDNNGATQLMDIDESNRDFQLTEARKNEHDLSHLNIDEGIEMDDDRLSILLPEVPSSPTVKVFQPPSIFPKFPDEVDVSTDFVLPTSIREEVTEARITNMLMIPLKKLKHKCAFSLPEEEFGELKRMKREQSKNNEDVPLRQTRIFNPFEIMRAAAAKNEILTSNDEEEFLGFTEEQQKADLSELNFDDNTTLHDVSRKNSNDSGFDDCTGEFDTSAGCSSSRIDETSIKMKDSTADPSQISHRNSIDLDERRASADDIFFDASDEFGSNLNISGGDSCYHSCVSGGSAKTELSEFFRDIESRNRIIDEQQETENTNQMDDETAKQSEERVKMMQQTAMNVAKWKEHLKPMLIGSELRSKVDIKECASQMIGKIGQVNETKSFNELTEPYKTPIMFLTMLQLINNRNITITHPEKSMRAPTSLEDIKVTLKSKVLHQEKFNELGQQFEQEEIKKTTANKLKRKLVQTSTPSSTPVKRVSLGANESAINNMSIDEDDLQDSNILSQSSGYCSQLSTFSDL